MKVDLIIEKICFAGVDPKPEEIEYDLSLVKGDKRVDIDMFGLNIITGTVTFPLNSFNPYSPGFSIYLGGNKMKKVEHTKLQSLFTWIFYLFKDGCN